MFNSNVGEESKDVILLQYEYKYGRGYTFRECDQLFHLEYRAMIKYFFQMCTRCDLMHVRHTILLLRPITECQVYELVKINHKRNTCLW